MANEKRQQGPVTMSPTSPLPSPPATSTEEEEYKDPYGSLEDMERYLRSKGWVRVGVRSGQPIYRDLGYQRKPDRKEVGVRTKSREGKVETVEQTHGDPISWDYPVEEAVGVQKTRDAAEEAKELKERKAAG